MEKYNYGVIGLGVMGRNLLYNIADHNFSVAGFDLDEEKVKELHDGATSGMKVKGSTTLEDFVSALEIPRKIILMVPAGKPVDAVLENITPLLSPGDIVVDAGNSYFEDTNRRIADLAAKIYTLWEWVFQEVKKEPEQVPALCRAEIWRLSVFFSQCWKLSRRKLVMKPVLHIWGKVLPETM